MAHDSYVDVFNKNTHPVVFSADLFCPAVQLTHSASPSALHFPRAQGTHTVAPDKLDSPAEHFTHLGVGFYILQDATFAKYTQYTPHGICRGYLLS